tara:strand:- start:1264 stop:1749 length:486 start_codon:yes stop_codon:yes gene_type:complete
MATTSTNKQPLLIDRVFHNVIESNVLTSGSDTALDILGTNQSAVLVDCTANDGGIVEDLYAISRTTSTTAYKVLFYLSSSVDYLRPGEGVYIGSLDSETTPDTKSEYVMPKVLAPVAHTGDEPQLGALYIPRGRALWVTLQLPGPVNSSDTPIVGAQGGYY